MRHLRATLLQLRAGRGDPTTRVDADSLWRATHTPDGPGTVRIAWADGAADAWGPGGEWLARRVPHLAALDRPMPAIRSHHEAVARALRNHPDVRFPASGTLYHELLPIVLAQRITGGEAVRQWARLVHALGEPAPGPHPDLRLPPAPGRLARQPTWWFHPLGIERSRAATLVEIARHADRLWQWAELDGEQCEQRLRLLPGVGVWTAGNARRLVMGDPDAVEVGDFHVKHTVVWALAGRPRGTDDEMLELLEPYRGERGRVVRLLQLDGWREPAFGPRQRVVSMSRW